ncbi:hypothetical protein OH76DRAFT_1409764 [Lentinus brumalis]|uniref:Uncharacterized protein n=1 Tax=Lentinus brumalis TaxID=2498619 RepID=A0A371CU55_9APHY|nr:hypothetical protein OH76DRAFT_1409764 [Polyporus brumalis]
MTGSTTTSSACDAVNVSPHVNVNRDALEEPASQSQAPCPSPLAQTTLKTTKSLENASLEHSAPNAGLPGSREDNDSAEVTTIANSPQNRHVRFETDDDDNDEEDDEGSDTDYSDDDPDAEFTGEPPRLNYGPMVDYEEAVKRSWKSAVELLGEEFMLSTKGAARHVSQRQDSVDKGADKASE